MEQSKLLAHTTHSLLLLIHGFIASTAIFGGLQLLLTNGLGMSSAFLHNSPFPSFFVPAVILICIVGGTQLFASYLMVMKKSHKYEASAIASFGLLIWIFVELSIILKTLWLQSIYFGLGIISLVLVFILITYFPHIDDKEHIHNRQWYE